MDDADRHHRSWAGYARHLRPSDQSGIPDLLARARVWVVWTESLRSVAFHQWQGATHESCARARPIGHVPLPDLGSVWHCIPRPDRIRVPRVRPERPLNGTNGADGRSLAPLWDNVDLQHRI